ncbi:glycine cleavage system protein H [Gammaproteobacteria bacterium 53_120_T64]|nr:glycine cleavage system protein H [Gammaproteobacteria bacterium 53_120_T64]
MSDTPKELKYAPTHEWVLNEGDDVVSVGITDFAQESLGDVVYVELPEVGDKLSAADEAGAVESVKAASDIFAPVSGEVIAVNTDLEDSPETINEFPYGDGWFFKLKMSDPSEMEHLLSADEYIESTEEE